MFNKNIFFVEFSANPFLPKVWRNLCTEQRVSPNCYWFTGPGTRLCKYQVENLPTNLKLTTRLLHANYLVLL